MILALAVSVNLRAATVSLGTSKILLSSVTVPTITAVLCLNTRSFQIIATYVFFPKFLISFESESGGLLILEERSLLRTVLANDESVLLERNLKSYKELKMFEFGYLDEQVLVKVGAL